MCAQKNHLNEMVLLSTHNICFCLEMRKMIFYNTLTVKPVLSSHSKIDKTAGGSLMQVQSTIIDLENNFFCILLSDRRGQFLLI